MGIPVYQLCQMPISIHAPREGGDQQQQEVHPHRRISIHAPREGGDGTAEKIMQQSDGISIHAPREGGDRHMWYRYRRKLIFQSTPPARGATFLSSSWPRRPRFQSTPPARGATAYTTSRNMIQPISIHAPREGGDTGWRSAVTLPPGFQSTPPARGATLRLCAIVIRPGQFQSTPPPREGGDTHARAYFGWLLNFNPRPPRGGRL